MQQTLPVPYSAVRSAEPVSFSLDVHNSIINVLAHMGMGRSSTDAHRALEYAVRGDLVRILTKLLKGKTRYDGILIETTGLADPAPVAQTFFVDVCPSTQAAPVDCVQALFPSEHGHQPEYKTRYDGTLIETQGWLTLHQALRPSLFDDVPHQGYFRDVNKACLLCASMCSVSVHGPHNCQARTYAPWQS